MRNLLIEADSGFRITRGEKDADCRRNSAKSDAIATGPNPTNRSVSRFRRSASVASATPNKARRSIVTTICVAPVCILFLPLGSRITDMKPWNEFYFWRVAFEHPIDR